MERVESHQEVWKQYSGRVAWASFALAFVCILAFPALAYLGFTGSIPLWAAVMGNTLLAYLAFTPLHEASHSNIGTRKGPFRWLDSLVGWLMAGILFAPYSAFKVLHLRHHSNTNDPDSDPDRWMSTSNPLGLLLRGLTIMPRYYFHYFRHMDKQGRDNLPATLTGVLLLAAIATGLSYNCIVLGGCGSLDPAFSAGTGIAGHCIRLVTALSAQLPGSLSE
jgi:beta-carotene hydroxylase